MGVSLLVQTFIYNLVTENTYTFFDGKFNYDFVN